MARYTLVYGLRLLPEGTLINADDVRLTLTDGETAGLTLHTIDGTIPQLRRALDRSLDAYFEFLPGATDEDKREFDDSSSPAYISTCTPSSTTRSGGSLKKAVARTAFRAISTNSFSRHVAMPFR